MASDHLRLALHDGRAVLAGGPGLGPQMILLRNDAASSIAQQHSQGTSGYAEGHYPLQGFAETYDGSNRKASADVGAPGTMPLDPNRGVGIKPSAPSIYSHSVISPGLGFQNVDYPHQDAPGMQNPMQPYGYTQSNPDIASNAQGPLFTGGGEQGYPLQNYGGVPSAEIPVNTERHVGQEALPGGVSAPAGAVTHFQGNAMEDSRRLAMVHEFGNGSAAYSHQATPQFQTGYRHDHGNGSAAYTHQGPPHFQPGYHHELGNGSSAYSHQGTPHFQAGYQHEFGNGPVAYSHQATPPFQPGYNHPGKPDPVSVDQASLQNPIYPAVQETEVGLQRMRELQSQIICKRQLEMELQHHYPQRRELNIGQRYARFPSRMTKGGKYSRLFHKSGMKKEPKVPPLAGPDGPGWCSICQADCNTAEILQQHVGGKQHQKKLLQLQVGGPQGPGWCSICQADCNTAEILQQHITGKKHQKKLLLVGMERKDPPQNPKQITTADGSLTHLKSKSKIDSNDQHPESCLGPRKHDVCAEEPTVEPPAKKPHLSDEIGIPQEPQTNESPPLFHEVCKICDVACNSQVVLDAHLKGRRHAANAKKLGAGVPSINLGSLDGTGKAFS